MADTEVFNPRFSFDAGVDADTSAWDLTGALRQVERTHSGTTVDQKIERQLHTKERKQSGKKRKLAPADFDETELNNDVEGNSASDNSEEDVSANASGSDSDEAFDSSSDPDDRDEEEENDVSEGCISGATPQAKRQHTQKLKKFENKPAKNKGNSLGSAPYSRPSNATDSRQDNALAKKDNSFFGSAPGDTKFHAYSFMDLQLSRPLAKACTALGYEKPTPIQAACIPLALAGRDICGSAVTGSGKTAAYALPLLECLLYRPRRVLATYVLVLTPTRELAVQVHSMIQNLAKFTDIRTALVVGGLSLKLQAATLRTNPEIVVATPGRLIDHVRNSQSVGLEDLHVLVLDEADKLLSMGFKEEVKEIVQMAPRKRQTMLFSATMTDEVKKLAALSLQSPIRLAADPMGRVPKRLVQEIIRLKGANVEKKDAIVLALCSRTFRTGHVLIFCTTKQQAHRMKLLFGMMKLPPAGELHGNMTQADRLDSLEKFRTGEYAFLLATDVAGRGLDILGVQVVINVDAPRTLDIYLHRIGRTARAGKHGRAITLIADEDRKILKEIVKKTQTNLRNRIVPAEAVLQFQAAINDLADDVDKIVKMEQCEAQIRKAETEAERAQNVLDHEKEIFMRPKRTWFQSKFQKEEIKKLAKAESAGELQEDTWDDCGKQTQDQKGKKKAKSKLQAERKTREEKQPVPPLLEETSHLRGAIKAAKVHARKLCEQGMRPHQAVQLARSLAAKGDGGQKKKRKTQQPAVTDKNVHLMGTGEGLFAGDGRTSSAALSGPARVYPGGAKLRSKHRTIGAEKKKQRPGRSAVFKSKKRYKRK